MRYICVLRYGISEGEYEYIFSKVRREQAAINECAAMIENTKENMEEHSNGGRAITGAHPTDPRATVVACVNTDGKTYYKTVTYREANRQ